MKFGTKIYLRRGGHLGSSPGSYRCVRAKYIGARGSRVYCKLLEDDPLAIVKPKIKGESGWWEQSIVITTGTTDIELNLSNG